MCTVHVFSAFGSSCVQCMSRARSVLLGLVSGCRVVSGRRFVVGLAASVGVVAAAAVFRWVRSWRQWVGRLFALVPVLGLQWLASGTRTVLRVERKKKEKNLMNCITE